MQHPYDLGAIRPHDTTAAASSKMSRRAGTAPVFAQAQLRFSTKAMRAVSTKIAKALATLGWIAGILLATLPAFAKEPRVAPGLTQFGVVQVALLGYGIDYRLPELKSRLARDGEGDLIAWDFTDKDNRPFADGGPGTEASVLFSSLTAKAQLVVVKERPNDTQAFGHSVSFAARTSARIFVWLSADSVRPDWQLLAAATRRFYDRLFIVPVPSNLSGLDENPSFVCLRRAPNLLLVTFADAGTSVAGSEETLDLVLRAKNPLPSANTAKLPAETIAAVIAAELPLAHCREIRRKPISRLKERIVATKPKGIAKKKGELTMIRAFKVFRER